MSIADSRARGRIDRPCQRSVMSKRVLSSAISIALLGACAADAATSGEAPGTEHHKAEVKKSDAPQLTASKSREFVTAAGRANAYTRDAFRAELARVSTLPTEEVRPLVAALEHEFYDALPRDQSRAIVALAVIGEIRSAVVEPVLQRVLRMPLPERVSLSDTPQGVLGHTPVMDPRSALEAIEARAIQGLAYQRTASSNASVLDHIANHESKVVRAVGVSAYQWNNGDDDTRRTELLNVVRPRERFFLDRVQTLPGDNVYTRSERVERFRDTYPELQPPPPTARGPVRPATPGSPQRPVRRPSSGEQE